MSKIEVNKIGPQCGTTLTVGCGAGQTVTVDANTVTIGRCGGTVALASGASQTGFGRTGTVDWQTGSIKTSTFTAVDGQGFFADTSSSAFTMNLPAGTAGSIVAVADYTNTFQTNNLTITPNGSQKIGGIAASQILTVEGLSATFIYVDDTEGWKNINDATSNIIGNVFMMATGGTVTECGNCKIHTFTGPGTFAVSQIHPSGPNNAVNYTVVGGGGAGGYSGPTSSGAGGGGAGGYRASGFGPSPLQGTAITATVASFPIAVGAGGASEPGPSTSTGNSGSVSTFSTITSAGGGGGGGASPSVGGSGGSGGGGQAGQSGGSGNTPPVTPPQGSNGGTGWPGSGSQPAYGGGGGGGVAENGVNGGPSAAGRGGVGVPNTINGSSLSFSGGGGGGAYQSGTVGAASPCGTGGVGTNGSGTAASGTTNRGGGGGGSNNNSCASTNGAGGSGIVILRYKFK